MKLLVFHLVAISFGSAFPGPQSWNRDFHVKTGKNVMQIRAHDQMLIRKVERKSRSTSLNFTKNMVNDLPRGGSTSTARALLDVSTADGIFNTALKGLAGTAVFVNIFKTFGKGNRGRKVEKSKPKNVVSLQARFLLIFWIIRCADWLQGPYFYEVYKSKVFNGVPATMDLVSKIFLAGFASTAVLGPSVGKFSDQFGRKKGTLAFCALYFVGALSTKSSVLSLLFFGRLLNGIGTSFLFSAPEAWFVGESQKEAGAEQYLGETFGLAYAGDAIVAIVAGKLSGMAATERGPTGPFELSSLFLVVGAALTSLLWKENVAERSSCTTSDKSESSIKEAIKVVQSDFKILLVGTVQALFEAAMYIFVLQWPPAMTSAIKAVFPKSLSNTPFGTIFSCFMACCLLGSTLFNSVVNGMSVNAEPFTAGMLLLASLSMAGATVSASLASAKNSINPKILLATLTTSFFLFESCVGMYFPSIGTLRSKYIPDSHRSIIMNLFGIPLNVLVVTVFLVNEKLGISGALGVSASILGFATVAMWTLLARNKNGVNESQIQTS